jgi:nicotinamidase-related amidase
VGGVEHNYNMMIVEDAVAEVHRDAHEAELRTMQRVFAEVKSTGQIIEMLAGAI